MISRHASAAEHLAHDPVARLDVGPPDDPGHRGGTQLVEPGLFADAARGSSTLTQTSLHEIEVLLDVAPRTAPIRVASEAPAGSSIRLVDLVVGSCESRRSWGARRRGRAGLLSHARVIPCCPSSCASFLENPVLSDAGSALWRETFVETFLMRDVAEHGLSVPVEALRRFWTMVAHYHGQVWNAAEFARAIGAGEGVARRHLDVLAAARMVRVLPPWFENLKKRQVRAPKIYVRDTGLLHSLLGLAKADDVYGHPKVGSSFEGFGIEQVLSCSALREAYFWATHAGAELDLMVGVGGRRYGFEFKYSDAPGTTKSMRTALRDLGLRHLWVVYPGDESYALDEQISVLPIRDIPGLNFA